MSIPIRAITLLALALGTGDALALVLSVNTTPSTSNVAVNRGATRTVTWTVVRENGNTSPTVSSPHGQFITSPGGQVLQTVNTTLSQTKPISGVTTTFTFTETVRVPAAVAIKANRLGAEAVVYRRTFDDGFGPHTGDTTFALTGSSGGEFAVERVMLRFDDDSVSRVASVDEPLSAELEVSFAGSGQFEGVWELADPASTSGEAIFRRLRTVHRPLLGGRRIIIDSPPLPTDRVGIHLLRFRITEPDVDFEPLLIRYAVVQREEDAADIGRLRINEPPPGAQWSPETAFSWQSIEGARAYRLEIYRDDRDGVDYALPDLGTVDGERGAEDETGTTEDPRRITGMLLDGGKTTTALSSLARTRLSDSGRYRWRVVAIGHNGRVIARSPLRELWVP